MPQFCTLLIGLGFLLASGHGEVISTKASAFLSQGLMAAHHLVRFVASTLGVDYSGSVIALLTVALLAFVGGVGTSLLMIKQMQESGS